MNSQPQVLDVSVHGLSVPQQFFAYAEAYRDSAEALCEKLIVAGGVATWPKAAVVLMTAAHATELYLKALILMKTPSSNVNGHNINLLAKEFRRLYPEETRGWEVPFEIKFLGVDAREADQLIRTHPPASIRYRYPVAKDGSQWLGASAFRAQTFLPVLVELGASFRRVAHGVA